MSDLRTQLQSIYDQHGRLTPALVVDTARPARHPLHGHFEWDNRVAGEAWRREQAQQLIRAVRVVYREATEQQPEKSVRAFHAVRTDSPDNNGFSYEPAEKVAADPVQARILLNDMRREWLALQRRYGDFEEFWEMVSSAVAVT